MTNGIPGKSEHAKEPAKQPQHRSEDKDRRASNSSHKVILYFHCGLSLNIDHAVEVGC